MKSGSPRVALYSPGMIGLGHLRRNLLLVRAFAAAFPRAAFLMLAEAREAGSFNLPDAVDCITLPAIRKNSDGRCSARRLAVDLPTLVRMRSAVIDSALTHFEPDVLIVDHLPRGALGELGPTVEWLHRRGTRLVLGLRDILEAPATVQRDWHEAGHFDVVAEQYDTVWIYGDPVVYNPLQAYAFPEAVARKARFTGYLDPMPAQHDAHEENADDMAARLFGDRRVMLCQLGGGQDGIRLARAFVNAELPAGSVGVVVAGPFMPHAAREQLVHHARRRGMHVLGMITEPAELLRRADRVVGMGGYNSTCEIISLRKRALVVPRTKPRQEQLMRAARLSELGYFEMLHPDALTPRALSEWLAAPAPPPTPRTTLDMQGAARATDFLEELIVGTPIESIPVSA